MEMYGSFHAISTALKLSSSKVFESVSQKRDTIKSALIGYDVLNFRKSIGRKAADAFEVDEEEYSAFLKFIDKDLYGFLEEMFEDEELDVIIHGDCWTHNYLFGYKESKLSQAYLIDFQLSYRASPIIDLSYFMCTSGCSKAHFNNMEKYLKHYYNSFSKQMQNLGLAKDIIPFETLLKHWRKYGKYGLIWGMIINKMMIADKDELDKHHHKDVLVGFDFISRNEDLYHQRMRESISYFYENKML